ncbi:MAG: hypothetical protein GX338_02575 [Firmicutes bacterium]|nr:hypothetical protein [Bacillota bacterium]
MTYYAATMSGAGVIVVLHARCANKYIGAGRLGSVPSCITKHVLGIGGWTRCGAPG